jgi:rhamnogalacturonyl hydrolase YesR
MMAMVELLDAMPADHPQRAAVLHLLRRQAQGIASVQSGAGLWRQLLDRSDSYEETSASAMFTFAIARGVNRGWLDADAYAPVAIAGWNGLSTRISGDGHITGTCIGTSYADDAVYYAHRPAIDDVHGYGPTLMAGSEMIRLLQNPHLQMVGGRNGSPVMVRERR